MEDTKALVATNGQQALSVALLTPEKKELLRRTVADGCTDDELELFLHVCARTGLDPFAKQIYAIKRRQKVGDRWEERMTIQTAIDGYRLIADRTGCYAPGREPSYQYDKSGNLVSATAYVRKLVAGQWVEYGATAFWAEYVQTNRQGDPVGLWGKMPHGQLAKCAESLAIRRGFPAELSGVYTREEMQQAEEPESVPAEIVEPRLRAQIEAPPVEPAVVEEAAAEVTKRRLATWAARWYGRDEFIEKTRAFIAELTKDMPVPETLETISERTAAHAADLFERRCRERDAKPELAPAAEPTPAPAPQRDPAWKQVKQAAEGAGLAREACDTFLSHLGFATWQEITDESLARAMERAQDTTFVGSCNRTAFSENIVLTIENAGGVARALEVAEGWKARIKVVFGKNDVTVGEMMRRVETALGRVGGSMPKHDPRKPRQFTLNPD